MSTIAYRWGRGAVLVAMLLGAAAVRADELLVAVAANFAGPMARIAQDFQAATGHAVKLSSGATGRFYSQVVAGAPFDVLLAADDQTPARLVQEGHAVGASRRTYAVGRLVLWSADAGLVDDRGDVLAAGRFRHLAVANPKVAPYGRAALQVLQARGLAGTLAPKLVTGESIAQAHQFVATRNAELGFVALSQVAAPGKPVSGSMWRVPSELHDPIRQDAVLLQAGRDKPAAQALLAYLRSPAAQAVIRDHGYGLAD
jgi:molybdate transport system substrate-binding protein